MHVVLIDPSNVGVGYYDEREVAKSVDTVSESDWYQGEAEVGGGEEGIC